MILTFSQVGNLFCLGFAFSASRKLCPQKVFLLSQPCFQWSFNLLTPWNYPCQGHHHCFLILRNSSAALDTAAHPLSLKHVQLLISTCWAVLPLRFFLLSSFAVHLPGLTPPGPMPGALAGLPFLPHLHSFAR